MTISRTLIGWREGMTMSNIQLGNMRTGPVLVSLLHIHVSVMLACARSHGNQRISVPNQPSCNKMTTLSWTPALRDIVNYSLLSQRQGSTLGSSF